MQHMRSWSKNCDWLLVQKLAAFYQLLEFQEIWQKDSSETTWMIDHEKSEFWLREFVIIQKTIYAELQKLPMSIFWLKQCWQKGFSVNS